MPIIRKFAVQGHAVPSIVHSPRGPFPPEVLAQPQMAREDMHADSLHVGLDDVRFFKCKDCEEVLLQDELDDHECDE
jgi:hypothetical protein